MNLITIFKNWCFFFLSLIFKELIALVVGDSQRFVLHTCTLINTILVSQSVTVYVHIYIVCVCLLVSWEWLIDYWQQTNGQSMSHDRVRKIVQEEGRSARNLIAYNVPAVDGAQTKPGKILCWCSVWYFHRLSASVKILNCSVY